MEIEKEAKVESTVKPVSWRHDSSDYDVRIEL